MEKTASHQSGLLGNRRARPFNLALVLALHAVLLAAFLWHRGSPIPQVSSKETFFQIIDLPVQAKTANRKTEKSADAPKFTAVVLPDLPVVPAPDIVIASSDPSPMRVTMAASTDSAPQTAGEHADTGGGTAPMVGIWKIERPLWNDLHQWLPGMRQTYCRSSELGSHLTIACFGLGSARIEVRNGPLRISWRLGNDNFAFSGTLQSRSLAGTWTLVTSRGYFRYPVDATGSLLQVDKQADPENKSAMVENFIAGMRDGSLPVRPLTEQPAFDFGFLDRATLRGLGAITMISYVGLAEGGYMNRPLDYSVYQVEFEKGMRLCGLQQNKDGRVDRFNCI